MFLSSTEALLSLWRSYDTCRLISTEQQTVPQTDTITHDVHLPIIVSLLLFHFKLSLNIAWTVLASLGYKEAANRTWLFITGWLSVTFRYGQCVLEIVAT